MTKMTIQEHKTRENEVALLKSTIEKWIKENYYCTGLKISDNPNKDGLYEVTALKAKVKNRNITSLTNGMFEWVKTKSFSCSYCTSLTSLNGAPKEVEGEVYCHQCTALKSLKGAPKKVGRGFYCYKCISLKSLNGAPQEVGGNFSCAYCVKLKSLEGAPKKVEDWFDCYGCTSLKSLEGAPKEVGKNFYCSDCKIKFTEDDVKKLSNVKGKIYC